MVTPILNTDFELVLPRPDKLIQRLRLRGRSSQNELAKTKEILRAFGLNDIGGIARTSELSRSNQLIVESSKGKKILKSYKYTVKEPTIAHEHSIIRFLEKIDFPAPRLSCTLDGRTYLEVEGKYFALFDYLDGYFQYHNYLLSPFQTKHFIDLAGRALSTLHSVLKDFSPEGYNPDGFRSRTGERWRELNWYLDKLSWCINEGLQIRNKDDQQMDDLVRQYGSWVENEFYSLNEKLNNASIPRYIIHGDYGPFNLFFKQGSPVVILDFELSALDWRLFDIAKAFQYFTKSRFGFNSSKMNTFISAYRLDKSLNQIEMHLLPDAWLFLLFRRIIVVTHRYFQAAENKYLI
jgi:Ser/Thr protein kinase RdoA (MazF antagonist)